LVDTASGMTVSFVDCAVYDNDAGRAGAGGGVCVEGGGGADFTNCTIAGNKAALQGGGGVSVDDGNVSFTSCTVTGNCGSVAGGLHVLGTASLRGSIVAGNVLDNARTARDGRDSKGSDVLVNAFQRRSGTLTSDGYNLIGVAEGGKMTWKRTDTLDRSLSHEAIFGKNELADNGGPVKTLKIFSEGRAFAKIPAYVRWLPRYDERKRERRLFRVDIGALGSLDDSTFPSPVKTADSVPLDVKTWRQLAEAIEVINGGLFFGVSDDVVTLTEDICYDGDKAYPSLPVIETSLRIVGDRHRIDARATSMDNRPVFDIEGDARVRFEDLAITGGYADFGGGVHIVKGEADFARCRIAANLARFGGGGIYVREDGAARFQDCEIMNNGVRGHGREQSSVMSGGGGIGAGGRGLVLENCTVADNWADGKVFGGGGIFVQKGAASLNACIVSGNRSSGSGGGLHARRGRFVIENTRIVDNHGREAGALFVLDEGAELRNCRLTDNRTEYNGRGGAVFFSSTVSDSSRDGALQMTDTVGSKNVSGANGGGICVDSGRAFFIRCEITSNDTRGADSIGGGVITSYHGFFEGTAIKGNTARGEPDDLWITSKYGEGIVDGGGNVMEQVHGRFPGLEKNTATNKIVVPGQIARERAFEAVSLLRAFKGAAMMLWTDALNKPNFDEKFTVLGVLEYLGLLLPSEAAKLRVKVAENQWWVGCDVSSESAEVRAVLKSLSGICDENGNAYSGGPVAYMLAVTLRP
jgi:hypothetical protein